MTNESQKAKVALMKSMMGNPKISKIIHEAASAPLGSTKKTRAKSVISIIKKTNPGGVYAGKGGPGDLWGSIGLPSTSSSTSSYLPQTISLPSFNTNIGSTGLGGTPVTGATIFPSAPALKKSTPTPSSYTSLPNFSTKSTSLFSPVGDTIPSITKPQTFNTQTTTPSSLPQKTPSLDPLISKYEWAEKTTPSAPKGYAPSPLEVGYHKVRDAAVSNVVNPLIRPWGLLAEGVANTVVPAVKSVWDTAKSVATKVYEKPGQIISDYALPAPLGPDGKPIYSGDIAKITQNAIASNLASAKKTPVAAATKETKEVKRPDGSTEKVVTEVKPGQEAGATGPVYQPTFKQSGTTGVTGTTGTTGPTEKDSSVQVPGGYTGGVGTYGGTTTDTTYTSGAAGAGTGDLGQAARDMLFNQLPEGAVSGGADLQTLQSLFPAGTPVDQLPVGQNIQTQLLALQNAINDQYDIEEKRMAAEAIDATVPTAKQTMIDFVKARDQYIAHVDKLRADADTQFNSSDMSDPMNVNAYTQYTKFLDTMKANHNDRYATYLNKSLDRYEADVKRIDAAYDNAVKSSDAAFKMRGTMLKDIYDDQYKLLSDLNKMLDEAPKKAIEMEKARIDLQRAKYALIEDAMGTKSGGDMIGQIKDAGSYLWSDDSKQKGAIKDTINLASDVPFLLENNPKTSPTAVMAATGSGIKQKIAYASGDGSDPAVKVSKDSLKDLFTLASSPDLGGDYSNPDKARWWKNSVNQIGSDVIAKAGDSVTSYILGKSKEGSDISSLITDLGAQKGWLWGTSAAPTREEYIESHSDFDPTLLDALYDGYETLEQIDPGKSYTERLAVAQANGAKNGLTPEQVIANLVSGAAFAKENQLLAQLTK